MDKWLWRIVSLVVLGFLSFFGSVLVSVYMELLKVLTLTEAEYIRNVEQLTSILAVIIITTSGVLFLLAFLGFRELKKELNSIRRVLSQLQQGKD